MMKIYIWDNTNQPEWHVGMAMCEDGHVLASHCSSSIGWLKRDMGLYPDICKWKHDKYSEHCPDGYELVWIENPKASPELDAAYELNQVLAESTKETEETTA